MRSTELAESLDLLGAGTPTLLEYGDRAYTESAPDRGAFCDAPFDELVERVVGHIRAFRPDTVLTYDPLGIYGHPDHVQAHRVTLAAIGAAAYPQMYPDAGKPWQTKVLYLATMPLSTAQVLWPPVMEQSPWPDGPMPGVPDSAVDTTIDVSEWLDVKWQALCAHRSEMARGGAMTMLAALPVQTRRQVLRNEWFLRYALAPDSATADALAFGSGRRVTEIN
jgi:N-acetyl-1-D-myo-inositol-2-amino-2-deoxy-alpha-D-glucopyranoside deacetylase